MFHLIQRDNDYIIVDDATWKCSVNWESSILNLRWDLRSGAHFGRSDNHELSIDQVLSKYAGKYKLLISFDSLSDFNSTNFPELFI